MKLNDGRMIARAILALFALMVCTRASGQSITLEPIHSDVAFSIAEAEAKSVLAADAVPVLIGAVGDKVTLTQGGAVHLTFDPDSGTSSAWAYVFRSPSKDRRITIIGISIPGLGLQVFEGESPVPIPEQITTGLDHALRYATSASMITRLNADSVYVRYRRDFPAKRPEIIAFREVLAGDTLLPAAFPIDAPVWSLVFAGRGGDAMTCYVSGRTGETVCVRAANVASVVSAPGSGTIARLSVVAAEKGLRVRISVPEARTRRIAAALYDAAGRRVLEPTGVEGGSMGEWTLIFDMAQLPPGFYYCRAAGDGWSGAVGTAW